ncbi:MAG: hypothetical protein ACRDYV_09410, partial [Acidimicrobiia bacterium]
MLQRVCLDPRHVPCLDLSRLPAGAGPNPRIVGGVTFQMETFDGTPAPDTRIEGEGDRRGLVVGESLGIWLPDGVSAAELTVTRSTDLPVVVEAFGADGLSLGAATVMGKTPIGGFGGGPAFERLRLPAGTARQTAQQPFAVAAGGGFVYIADPANHRVRFLDPGSQPGCPCESDLAGNGAEGAPREGAVPQHSPLAGPYAVAVGSGAEAGQVYIADTFGHRVLRVAPDPASPGTARLTTVAGTGTSGFSGDGAAGPSAELSSPSGLARDTVRGVTYVADTGNHRIRAVLSDGTVRTVAGDGTPGYSGDGLPGPAARLDQPRGLALAGDGTLFVADTGNHAIRRLDPLTGVVTTVAGTGTPGAGGDGEPAVASPLNSPAGVAAGVAGDLYVADTGNHRIRRVDLAAGTVGTVAGTGEAGFGGDGGDARQARLDSPFGVAVDEQGRIYVADTANNRLRVVTGGEDGRTIAIVAGNGTPSYSPAPPAAGLANLAGVSSVAAWDDGDPGGRSRTFLADPFTNSVREVDERGRITTVAGDGVAGDTG